jgi:hypothetical protein
MESKSADLTKVKVKVFVGVGCRLQQVFALAEDGHLYVFDKSRRLVKWMDIKVTRAISLAISNEFLICGCSDGVVRLFSTADLTHQLTLPKAPPLGQANIVSGVAKVRIPKDPSQRFADVVGVSFDEINKRLLMLLSDKMMLIWDFRNL